MFALLFVSAMLTTAADRVPTFSGCPVMSVYRGPMVKPEVPKNQEEEKGYRTVLDDAGKSPNFAGHYYLSQDTCGTGCAVALVADRLTGAVDWVGGFASHYPPDFARGPDLKRSFQYRVGSRLLVAQGCRMEDERQCGTDYFEMTPRGARLIHSTKFVPRNQK